MGDRKQTDQDMHKRLAIDLYNLTYSLMEKKDRSKEETDTMIHAAHASRYHWGVVGTPINLERGEWQVSRVHSVVGQPEASLYHASRCLDICKENGIMDWDIAFAYEAMARAHAIAGRRAEREKYFELAMKAGEAIKEKEDKDIFLSELKTVPP